MMQDSPAAHKNYTLAFYVLKEIATSKLNNYVLASIRATSGTSYPENIYRYVIYYICRHCK